jgi:hypothetical protein
VEVRIDAPERHHPKGVSMRKLIVLSLFTAVMLWGMGMSVPTHAQTLDTDLKPTFISPTPGLYVNGWPPFTLSYPKEWVEIPLTGPAGVFMAAAVRPDLPPSPVLNVSVFPGPPSLEDWVRINMPIWTQLFTDIKVLYDKPSQLKDGTPAREVEVEFVPKIALMVAAEKKPSKVNGLLLVTKKDITWVSIWMSVDNGRVGDDLKKIAYSLTFQSAREEPVTVPLDVRAFLDMFCADTVSGDLKVIMSHFSDRFRHSGASKPFMEQIFRNEPAAPIQRGVTSYEATVTVFEAHGDKAYIDGFFLEKAKDDATALKGPMQFQQIINEHGQWKWFGNQK